MAAYEMNHFKNDYHPKVIANARTFAQAFSDRGFEPAGEPHMRYTETHQVILPVGYGRGPNIACRKNWKTTTLCVIIGQFLMGRALPHLAHCVCGFQKWPDSA